LRETLGETEQEGGVLFIASIMVYAYTKAGESRVDQIDHLERKGMTEVALRPEAELEAETEAYRKYTPEQIIGALAAARGMIAPAARALGCSRNTIKAYMHEYQAIAQTIADEREATTDVAELKLYDAIERGEAWAICFYLKCQAKNRGYVERAELTGSNGAPVKIKLVYDE
jgi:hypothetical protein